MIRTMIKTVGLAAAVVVATASAGLCQPAPVTAETASEQLRLAEGQSAAGLLVAEGAGAFPAEFHDLPLPPRRPVRIAQPKQAKIRKIVRAAPPPVPTPPVKVQVQAQPFQQVAMIRPVPRVWMTIGSGF